MENAFLRKLVEITEAHLSDPQFGVEELARKLGMSYSSLRRRVSNYTGKSANQLIREIRLKKAFEILQQEDITIAEAAYRTGFNSPNYFNFCFHEYFGYPPGELRRGGGRDYEEPAVEKRITAEISLTVHQAEADIQPIRTGLAGDLAGKRGARILIIAAAVILSVMAGILLIGRTEREQERKKTVAVLPVKITGGSTQLQRFGDGLHESLMNELSKMDLVHVRSRISADRFRNPEESAKEIGRKLKAEYIIYLTLAEADGEYQVWITLVESRFDQEVWSLPCRRVKAGDFDTQTVIVRDVIRELVGFFQRTGKTEKSGENTLGEPAASHLLQGHYYADPRHFEPAKAIASYREVISLKPGLAEAYIGIAAVMNRICSDLEYRSDSLDREIGKYLDQADRIAPGSAPVLEQRALWLSRRGDLQGALTACSLALEADPASRNYLYCHAGILMSIGRWKNAKESLLKVIGDHPFAVYHFERLAAIEEHLRDFAQAEVRYREAASLDPTSGSAIFGLTGISLKTERDPARSASLFDTLCNTGLPQGPDSLMVSYQQVMLDLCQGRYEEAIRRLAGWQRNMAPGPPWYCRPKHLLMAELYGLMKRPDPERICYDSARLFLERLREKSTGHLEDPRVVGALGIAWAGLGNRAKAIACAEEAEEMVSLKPDAFLGPFVMEDVALVYARTGQQKKATEILRGLLARPGPLTRGILQLDPRWKQAGIAGELLCP